MHFLIKNSKKFCNSCQSALCWFCEISWKFITLKIYNKISSRSSYHLCHQTAKKSLKVRRNIYYKFVSFVYFAGEGYGWGFFIKYVGKFVTEIFIIFIIILLMLILSNSNQKICTAWCFRNQKPQMFKNKNSKFRLFPTAFPSTVFYIISITEYSTLEPRIFGQFSS